MFYFYGNSDSVLFRAIQENNDVLLDVIESQLFVSETKGCLDQPGRVPDDSTLAMITVNIKIAGEVMATCIVQGGPAPDFLATWVYNYLVSGTDGITVNEEKIANPSVKELINNVSE